MNVKYLFIGIVLYTLGIPTLHASNLPIAKIDDPIEFSGLTDSHIWSLATPVEMTTHAPNFGTTPTEHSEVRIAYNDEYLWIFARLYYSDPSKIISKSKKRDEESKSSDSFGVILDTYDDNESAVAFFTTPAGQRIDYSVANDANFAQTMMGASTVNYSWNTFWDVKTVQKDNYWSVEMRIPFSSIRFQEVNGKVNMGLILNRTVVSNNETYTFPEIDPKYGRYAPMKPSLAQTIELSGIKSSKPVYIAPYILTGIEQNSQLKADESGYYLEKNNKLTGGLDVKYSINSNLTLDLTANTDFAQVEADDERVNITRYSISQSEKRMFFQERSSLFGFSLGRSQELFYSRRIGLTNSEFNPKPINILGGARLTGRIGKFDVGIINMQTNKYDDPEFDSNDIFSNDESRPFENFGVYRIRRQVINPNSYVGVMATSRVNKDSTNLSLGADGVFRIFGDDYIETRVAMTTSSEDDSSSLITNDNVFAYLRWEKRKDIGFAYNGSVSYSGSNFVPAVGFKNKFGLVETSLRTQYGWLFGPESKLFSFKILLSGSYDQNIETHELEVSNFSTGVTLVTKSGWIFRPNLFFMTDNLGRELRLDSDTYVPEDKYQYIYLMTNISTPFSKPLSADFSLTTGQYYDGNRIMVSATPIYNLSSSIQFSGYYSFTRLRFDNRDQTFLSHIGRLKFLYMYNTKLSLSAFVQTNSLNEIVVGNFRLRYNPREGNDFFLVYNETWPLSNYDFSIYDESIDDYRYVEPIGTLDRSVMVKYVHTFKL